MELTEALIRNGKAMEDGPKRKTWSIHDLKQIKPLTQRQEDMFHDFFAGKHICAHGAAGSGRTYVAVFLALNEILRNDSKMQRIILVRSAVPTRDLGFMPGTLQEKIALYEMPYIDIFADLVGRYTTYHDMKNAGLVEFWTTSFIRGLTWDNAIVVVDECQNMTTHEINSLMTRIGQNARVILVGDVKQSDLKKNGTKNGFEQILDVVKKLPSFSLIEFTHHDIVRSQFVKEWIMSYETICD